MLIASEVGVIETNSKIAQEIIIKVNSLIRKLLVFEQFLPEKKMFVQFSSIKLRSGESIYKLLDGTAKCPRGFTVLEGSFTSLRNSIWKKLFPTHGP